MRNKKRRFTSNFFIFLLCLGLIYVISRSFAYEVITKNDQTVSNAEVKNVSDTADYATFSIKKKNSDVIGGKITIKTNKAYSTVNPTTLKARVEYSANNSTYVTYADTNLVVNGEVVVYEVLELPYETTYFRISLYNNGTRLDLTKRNIDCLITVKSTTATSTNYGSNGTFTASNAGIYRVELWGAGGNYYPSNMQDQIGAGAYTRGDIRLAAGTNLIVNVGQQRRDSTFASASTGANSTGGGTKEIDGSARSAACGKGDNCANSSGGGGATDVRLNSNLNSRIMVAAGGGGNVYFQAGQIVGIGGDGGGLVGYPGGSFGNYYTPDLNGINISESDGLTTHINNLNTVHDYAFGGTQKRGGITNAGASGNNGSFGYGGSGQGGFSAGGGGGYYGGAGGSTTRSYNGTPEGYTPGAGGSSFIAGHTGSISANMAGDGRCNETASSGGSIFRPESYVGTTANDCSIVTVGSTRYAFYDTTMIDGRGYSWTNRRSSTKEMPAPPNVGTAAVGTTQNGVGNVGSGAARITYVNPSGASGTATWNKKATAKIYVNHKYMDGTNVISQTMTVMDPEDAYCEYPKYDGIFEHLDIDHTVVTPDGYSSCGEVRDEDIYITFYYDWDTHVVTALYLDVGNDYSSIDDPVSFEQKHGTHYDTEQKSFPYYNYIGRDGDAPSGTVDGNKTVRYLYSHRTSTITINYLEDGTGTAIATPTTLVKPLGDSYRVTPLSIPNYKYVRVEGLEEGVAEFETITINYYYKVQESDIFINHVDCLTGETLRSQEKIIAAAGYPYDVTDKIKRDIPGYYLDYVPENAKGTYIGGDYEHAINVTYRYCRRDAVVVALYLEQGTNRELALRYEHGVNQGDEYETFAKNIENYRHLSTEGDYAYGTVEKDYIEVRYYYERKLSTLTVKYLDYDTNIELSPTERINTKWGLNYQTSAKNIENYYVFRIEGEPSGVVEGDELEVIYYYKRSEGVVTVRYVDEDTNGAIADNETIPHYFGETYTTERKVIPNYEYTRVMGNPTGVFYGNITVIYYYRLKDATLTVRHLDIDDNHVLFPDEVRNIKWNTAYTTSNRIFTGYDYIKVEGPASGRIDSDDLVVTYYYSRKTYTLTVRHLEEGSDNPLAETETRQFRYKEAYTTVPKVINNYKVSSVPTNANGRIQEDTTVTYYYARKDGELVIRYVDEETGENIIAPEITAVDFGERYEAYSFADGRRTFDDYDFVRVVGTEKGTIENERTEVIYYYKLKRGKVVVKYLDIDTNEELLDSQQENYKYNEEYFTHEEEIDGYRLDHIEGVTEGIFKGDVEVRYYYKKISLTVTIRFREEQTEEILANDIIQYKNYGDRYTTSKIDIDNYYYTRVNGNERGTMIQDVEVTYYYKKRDAKVIVKYLEKETNRALSPQDEIDVHWGDTYETEPVDVENYKVIEYPTNAYGTVSENEIVVIYYYGHRDAVVITKYLEDTTNRTIATQERRGYNYGDYYVTYQKDIYSYEFVRSEGPAYGVVSDEEITVTYFYRKTTRNLTVRYLELDTDKKIAADEVTTMDYGTTYQTSRKVLQNYNFYRVVGNEYGKLENDTTVTYYYTRKLATITVRHLDFETHDELAREEIINTRYGEEYETKTKDIRYYIYHSVSGVPSGIVESDNIEVTYYYIPKPAVVTSYYMDVANDHEIADREIQTVTYGEYYITKPSGGIPKNYEFLRKTPNYEGEATEDEINVYYYYQKIDSNVQTSIDLYGTNEVTSADDIISYYIEYKAKVSDYIGDGVITIVDHLPYGIYETASDLDGGVYNEEDKTITWVIDWKGINTFENEDEITVEKNISVTYNGIKSTDRSINNNVSGKLELENNERTVEADLATRIKISGIIVVHHYLEATTNQLFLDEIIEGLVGDTYITHEQTIEGFELVRRPFQETLTFEDNPFEVIYEYRKKKLHITTEVVGGFGDITGDEDVLYDGDSTPYNISIIPKVEYEIQSITVNDVEIEVTDPDGMTLEGFTGMTEDKNIKVTFTEKAIEVPITGKSSKLSIVVILMVIIAISAVVYFKPKKKKIKIER